MGTVITSGANVIAPSICRAIETGRDSQNGIHPVIGRALPDVTLRGAGARTGRVMLGFYGSGSEAASLAAEVLLARPLVFTIVTDERATLALSFVVSGRVARELDPVTRDAWTVTAEFQEVGA